METFSALLAICAGNSPVPGEFLTQRPVTRSFDVFFDLRLKAGDVRRYRAHHDVSVMEAFIGYGVPDTRIFGGLGARLIMQLRH